MKYRAALLFALAVAGCKATHEAPAGQGSAPPPPAPAVRPSQEPLPQLPPLELPADPKRAEKAELGHVLFFDKRLSANADRACYSCHRNEDGTGGHDPIAIGSGDKKQTRHAPALWNTAYFKGAWYWDGRATTLEDNATAAWAGGNMGVGGDYFNAGIGTTVPEADVDIGRMKVTSADKDWAAFKPPSLRNVARTAPYFHDG